MPGYLQLCRETWTRKLQNYDIVHLDDSNLAATVGSSIFDADAFRRVRPGVRKDAILVATLFRHGGIFMDLDTIVVGDIAPIVRLLERSAVVMFHTHLAFVAARRGASILGPWLEEIRRRIARLEQGETDPAAVPWGFFGNSILADLHRALVDRSMVLSLLRRARRRSPSPASGEAVRTGETPPSLLRRGVDRLIRSTHASELLMLDRDAWGFVPESVHPGTEPGTPVERYRRFWFDRGRALDDALLPGQRLIAIHHGSTPAWYTAFSREQVLADDTLLSRTLSSLLPRA
ncbi:MAG TPA: glycosyltransferase [Thermoanaerobaculia bacterium]|nr:glycosyltransferase [Thermoanaerobaculia bacterium]